MSAKKLLSSLRDLKEQFIFQGGSEFAISIANEIIKAYHKGRIDAVRGKFDQDYLDDVHKTGAGSSPPGKAP